MLFADSFDTDSGSDESGSDDTDSRERTSFNDNQLRLLTETYQSNKRPSRSLRKKMSAESGLSVRTIQIWFQNRRAKDRNQNGEINTRCFSTNNIINGEIQNKRQMNRQNHIFRQSTPQYDFQTSFENYQLYCPLDFLVPNEMPPNVDLSSADICNGEVVTGKRSVGNFNVVQQTNSFLPDGSYQWLTV